MSITDGNLDGGKNAPSGVPSPLIEDLDVGGNSIISSTGDVILDATATAGADILMIPDATGAVIVREEGGVAGTDELQMYFSSNDMYIHNKKSTGGILLQSVDSGRGVRMLPGGANGVVCNSSGTSIYGPCFPNANGTRDLGLSTLGWRNLYLAPSASITPATNGHLVFEATNDTTLTVKYKGSDGTVRSYTETLS